MNSDYFCEGIEIPLKETQSKGLYKIEFNSYSIFCITAIIAVISQPHFRCMLFETTIIRFLWSAFLCLNYYKFPTNFNISKNIEITKNADEAHFEMRGLGAFCDDSFNNFTFRNRGIN